MATLSNAPHQRRIQKKPGFSVLKTEETVSQNGIIIKVPKAAGVRRALGDVSNTAKVEHVPSTSNMSKLTNSPMTAKPAPIHTQNTVKAEKPYLNIKTLMHSEVYPDSDEYDDIWPTSERISADVIGQFMQPACYLRPCISSDVKLEDVSLPAYSSIPDSILSSDANNSNRFDSSLNGLFDDSPLLPVDF